MLIINSIVLYIINVLGLLQITSKSYYKLQEVLQNDALLSLRLTGVETLESVSQNFKRRFHFLDLVSGDVSKLTA